MTSQSTIILRFQFIIKNCSNNTVFIVLIVFIIKKCCNGSPFIVSSVYLFICRALIGGGGGVYSYIRVLPDGFLLKLSSFQKKSAGQNTNI